MEAGRVVGGEPGIRTARWKLAAGLWLYDALALFRNVKAHRMLGKHALLRAEPGLRERGLKGGARYYDAHGGHTDVGRHEGIMLPAGAYYWFEATSREPLVLVRIGSRAGSPPRGER